MPKAHVYSLPAYVVWSVWAGGGAAWLAEQAGRLRFGKDGAWLANGLLVALLALPLLLGWHRFERHDRSGDDTPRRFAEEVLGSLAPNAVVLCRWELCQPLRYLQFAEGHRLDVVLDQTEPEAGADWAERAALYAEQRPVYALQFNEQLAARYDLYPLSETYDLWQVLGPSP